MFDFGPGVSQADGAVKDRFSWLVVKAVGAEIAEAFELNFVFRRQFRQRWLEFAVGQNLEGVGVEVIDEVFALSDRIRDFLIEEAVVEAYFCVDGVLSVDPMDGALDFAVGVVAVKGAADFCDGSVLVFDDFLAGDNAGPAQADFLPWREAMVLWRRGFAEVILLNVELPAKGYFPGSGV